MSEPSVLSINERASEEFYKRGQEAEAQGSHERAVDFYERALNEDPDNEQACFRLALLYDRQADDAKAIELYERLCTSRPVHINALMNLAVLYEDNNHLKEASRCLDIVLRTDPNHERALLYKRDVESSQSMYYEDDGYMPAERRFLPSEAPISDFELTVRSRNCLRDMNINTLGDLLRITEQELLASKNFGETSLNEIKALLASRGLRLGQASEGLGAAATMAPSTSAHSSSSGHNDDAPSELLAKNVSEIELTVRSRKALQRLNINTLAELTSKTEEELLGCKNFGQTSLNDIKQQLETYGLSLRKLEN